MCFRKEKAVRVFCGSLCPQPPTFCLALLVCSNGPSPTKYVGCTEVNIKPARLLMGGGSGKRARNKVCRVHGCFVLFRHSINLSGQCLFPVRCTGVWLQHICEGGTGLSLIVGLRARALAHPLPPAQKKISPNFHSFSLQIYRSKTTTPAFHVTFR